MWRDAGDLGITGVLRCAASSVYLRILQYYILHVLCCGQDWEERAGLI